MIRIITFFITLIIAVIIAEFYFLRLEKKRGWPWPSSPCWLGSEQRDPSSGKGEVAMSTPYPLLGSSLFLFWKGGGCDHGHRPWSALEWTEGPWSSLPSFFSSVKGGAVAMTKDQPLLGSFPPPFSGKG